MNLICQVKRIGLISLLLFALFATSIFACSSQVRAASIPYASPWGKLYRNPEYQNNYGRCWYQTLGNGIGANMYLESYYTYGSSVSITYYYYPPNSNKKKYKKVENSSAHGSSWVEYTKNVNGTYINTNFYGAAHGITVNKTIK